MEIVNCNLCGADETEVLFEGYDRLHGQPGRFPLRRCRSCGLIYLSPRPDRGEIARYYPNDYAPYSQAIDDEPSWWHRWNRRYSLAKRVRAVLSRVRGTGRALDVGCATGNFLDALRRRGWEVHGVEVNAQAAAYARERLGLPVFTGDLVDAHFPDAWFDLVILWDVLEHLHDPKRALQEAARITQPGGTLVLSLPNPDSIEARVFGPHWTGWDVPRHLYIFTLDVLDRLLSETGWHISEVMNLTGRYWLLIHSIRFWLEEREVPELLRQALLRIAGSPLMRVMLPYFVVVERLGLGSVMTVFARRQEG
ncbi:MAG: class I SAM-dependent methyltransferase [Anaerolineae bacterium]